MVRGTWTVKTHSYFLSTSVADIKSICVCPAVATIAHDKQSPIREIRKSVRMVEYILLLLSFYEGIIIHNGREIEKSGGAGFEIVRYTVRSFAFFQTI